MATTRSGIWYPDQIAAGPGPDIPKDMKDMAESADKAMKRGINFYSGDAQNGAVAQITNTATYVSADNKADATALARDRIEFWVPADHYAILSFIAVARVKANTANGNVRLFEGTAEESGGTPQSGAEVQVINDYPQNDGVVPFGATSLMMVFRARGFTSEGTYSTTGQGRFLAFSTLGGAAAPGIAMNHLVIQTTTGTDTKRFLEMRYKAGVGGTMDLSSPRYIYAQLTTFDLNDGAWVPANT